MKTILTDEKDNVISSCNESGEIGGEINKRFQMVKMSLEDEREGKAIKDD